MAYLRKKTTKGIDYYSIVQSRRVNGKVKQEILEYIGTLDRLYEKLTADQNKDVSLKSYEHGASYGLLKIAGYLNIPELLEQLSELLDARVTIGRLGIMPFNRVILRDVTVETAPGDTALTADRLGVGVAVY